MEAPIRTFRPHLRVNVFWFRTLTPTFTEPHGVVCSPISAPCHAMRRPLGSLSHSTPLS